MMKRFLFAAVIAVLAAGRPPAAAAAGADCAAFAVSGNPQAAGGATWTYHSTEDGAQYALEGVLFVPAGAGPFPAVIVSHGKGGAPRGYSAAIGRAMVAWELVVIGAMYTHAPDADDAGNLPDGADGASPANVLRARKARELLACVGAADPARVAVHGHSMGAFVSGQLLGSQPADILVGSHSAGGVSEGPNATTPAAAAQIRAPYQLHHGDQDTVVRLELDQALAGILATNGVSHELHVYPGVDHAGVAFDPAMLARVRAWYEGHGLWRAAPRRAVYLPAVQAAAQANLTQDTSYGNLTHAPAIDML